LGLHRVEMCEIGTNNGFGSLILGSACERAGIGGLKLACTDLLPVGTAETCLPAQTLARSADELPSPIPVL
jgi:hypothetical protein